MRIYETAHDHRVLPGLWMVARLDGRSFTRLVREVHPFAAPFDPRFRAIICVMLSLVCHTRLKTTAFARRA
jgi:tRNA(His) guanylyltransferase